MHLFLCLPQVHKFTLSFKKENHYNKSNFKIFKLRQGASISRFVGRSVGWSVGLSVRLSKKILHLENDLSEQILENESYSGS